MTINISWEDQLPNSLENTLVVVIDVLAATSNIPLFLHEGAQDVIAVSQQNIFNAVKLYPDALCIGESQNPNIKKLFTYSNMPSLLYQRKIYQTFANKKIIYMTNNGTRVIYKVMKKNPSVILTASFVNLQAVIKYIVKLSPSSISLIPSGEMFLKNWKTIEDLACAQGLKNELQGKKVNYPKVFNKISKYIKNNYLPLYLQEGLNTQDMKKDLTTILRTNIFPEVPYCTKGDDSLIHIKSSFPLS